MVHTIVLLIVCMVAWTQSEYSVVVVSDFDGCISPYRSYNIKPTHEKDGGIICSAFSALRVVAPIQSQSGAIRSTKALAEKPRPRPMQN